jgi:hypothetical protein
MEHVSLTLIQALFDGIIIALLIWGWRRNG